MDLAKLLISEFERHKTKNLVCIFSSSGLDHEAVVLHTPADNPVGVAFAPFAVAGVPAGVEQVYLLQKIPLCFPYHF